MRGFAFAGLIGGRVMPALAAAVLTVVPARGDGLEDRLARSLRLGNPGADAGRVSLEGCQLEVENRAEDRDSSGLVLLRVDLAQFMIDEAGATGGTLTLRRKPVTAAMLESATRLVAALPARFAPLPEGTQITPELLARRAGDGSGRPWGSPDLLFGLDDARLRARLDRPRGKIAFSLQQEPGGGTTPEHVREFTDFMQALRDLPPPMTVVLMTENRRSRSAPGAMEFYKGNVKLPAEWTLPAATQEEARALAKAFGEVLAECP